MLEDVLAKKSMSWWHSHDRLFIFFFACRCRFFLSYLESISNEERQKRMNYLDYLHKNKSPDTFLSMSINRSCVLFRRFFFSEWFDQFASIEPFNCLINRILWCFLELLFLLWQFICISIINTFILFQIQTNKTTFLRQVSDRRARSFFEKKRNSSNWIFPKGIIIRNWPDLSIAILVNRK